jgi:hypothetical protein
MKPRWRVITVEERGGRLVYVLEHERSGERERIYRRGRIARHISSAPRASTSR